MNEYRTRAVKDDSKFCICGKRLAFGHCPECDPVIVQAIARHPATARPQPKAIHGLRPSGFGKYDFIAA